MTDWQKGDLALCVKGKRHPEAVGPCNPPRAGKVFVVDDIIFIKTNQTPSGRLMLVAGDMPLNNNGRRCWAAYRFVKVTPPPEMAIAERREEMKA